MSSSFPFRRVACSAVAVFFSLAVPVVRAAGPPPEIELGGRLVTMSLVSVDGLAPVAWPAGNFTLNVTDVSLPTNPNVYRLLLQHGIAPDSEAFTLVYDLNPAVKDFKGLSQGFQLRIPTVTGEGELATLRGGRYLVQLTIDAGLRRGLNDSSDRLRAMAERFAQRFRERATLGSHDVATTTRVETLAKWYGLMKTSSLQRSGPPLRRDSLLQLRAEADALTTLLSAAAGSNRWLSDDDHAQISAIYEDVELEMKRYGQQLAPTGPKAEALYTVVVNLVGQDEPLIKQLRVYYTLNGLFRDPPVNPPVISYPFKQLGFGRRELLPVKNYRMWAARDGDPGHPLTPILFFSVSGAEDPVTLELGVTRPAR